MATNHKITIEFARSIKRRVDVHVDRLLDYELTLQGPARYQPSGGAVRSDALVATGITLGILLIIIVSITLLANG